MALAVLGWFGMLTATIMGRAILVFVPVAIGLSIALGRPDETPGWLRFLRWAGVAAGLYGVISMLGLAALVLVSDDAAIDPPPVPPSATILQRQSGSPSDDFPQSSVGFRGIPGGSASAAEFYDELLSPSDDWIPQVGLNDGEWCWLRPGDESMWEAVVLAESDADTLVATALQGSEASFSLPAEPTKMDCAVLVGTVLPLSASTRLGVSVP